VPRDGPDEAEQHLLDFAEVLHERDLYCTARHVPVEEELLPAAFRDWRREHLRAPPEAHLTPSPADRTSPSAEGRLPQTAVLRYLYASPLGSRQLDVATELEALQRVQGIRAEVHVATSNTLREALVSQPGNAVVHISAHCLLRPSPGLLVENSFSQGARLSMEDLASMGPWDQLGLLVFLGCGSQFLVHHLFDRCGEFPAICCTDQVFDSAAKLFFKAFYHALGAGHTVRECYQWAQNAVRCAGNGMQQEAKKFVLLGCRSRERPCTDGAALGPQSVSRHLHWPRRKRVEQYVSRIGLAWLCARAFRDRRVASIWGPEGIGKTAFCREFCHHFSAPGGRMFSAAALLLERGDLEPRPDGDAPRDAFARAALDELFKRGPACVVAEVSAISEPWEALRTAARRLNEFGSWLLVLDGLESTEADSNSTTSLEFLVGALLDLLDASEQLRLLITSRSQWKRLGEWKVTGVEVKPMPPREAALVFLRNTHRHLHLHDFSSFESFNSLPTGSLPEPLELEAALDKLVNSPLMGRCGGVPRRLVEAADEVDGTLPSLRRHPLLHDPGG